MSAMGSAAEEAARLADAATKALQERITAGADAFASMFSSIVTGAKTAKQALSDLLMQMAEVQLRNAIMGFAGNGAGGAFGFLGSLLSPIPAFAGGTNSAPGGMALVGERGPELVNLPQGSQVHTAQATSRMLGGNTSRVVIAIDAGPEFAPRIASIAGPIAVEVVRENSRQMAQSQRRA